MNRKWLWLVIIAVAVGGFVVGVVVAQEDDGYFWFLPERYSESYTPTLGEWRVVQFNAFEDGEWPLTDRLQQTNCTLWVSDMGLDLEVDTRTRPGWDVYLGDGEFACSDDEVKAAYTEAAEKIADTVSDYFPELDTEDLWIDFFIGDKRIVAWIGGEMFLNPDEESE